MDFWENVQNMMEEGNLQGISMVVRDIEASLIKAGISDPFTRSQYGSGILGFILGTSGDASGGKYSRKPAGSSAGSVGMGGMRYGR